MWYRGDEYTDNKIYKLAYRMFADRDTALKLLSQAHEDWGDVDDAYSIDHDICVLSIRDLFGSNVVLGDTTT